MKTILNVLLFGLLLSYSCSSNFENEDNISNNCLKAMHIADSLYHEKGIIHYYIHSSTIDIQSKDYSYFRIFMSDKYNITVFEADLENFDDDSYKIGFPNRLNTYCYKLKTDSLLKEKFNFLNADTFFLSQFKKEYHDIHLLDGLRDKNGYFINGPMIYEQSFLEEFEKTISNKISNTDNGYILVEAFTNEKGITDSISFKKSYKNGILQKSISEYLYNTQWKIAGKTDSLPPKYRTRINISFEDNKATVNY